MFYSDQCAASRESWHRKGPYTASCIMHVRHQTCWRTSPARAFFSTSPTADMQQRYRWLVADGVRFDTSSTGSTYDPITHPGGRISGTSRSQLIRTRRLGAGSVPGPRSSYSSWALHFLYPMLEMACKCRSFPPAFRSGMPIATRIHDQVSELVLHSYIVNLPVPPPLVYLRHTVPWHAK